MKTISIYSIAISALIFNSAVYAQDAGSVSQQTEHKKMQPGMPGMQNMQGMQGMQGMQHHKMPKIQANPNPLASANPAQVTGPTAPVPNLLQEASKRPAMQLSQFKQFALAANPTLRQANALVLQSAGQAKQAGLWPNPSAGYEGAEIRGGSFHGGEQGAFVQQTFVFGGKLRLRRNVFEQQRAEDQIGVTEQRTRVLSSVEQSYYTTLAAQEMVNVRRRLLKLTKDAVVTAHQLANVGQADAPDVLQSEVEQEQAKVNYTTAQRTYIQDFRALAALVAKPNLPLAPLAGNLENPPSIDAKQIVNQIVQNSPSVKRAQQDIVRTEAEIKSAKREVVPNLSIQAGVEQNFETNELAGRPVGVQGFATAGVNIPIFNRNQGNVRAAAEDRARAQSELTRVRLSIRKTAQTLLQEYLSSLDEANRYKNEMIPRAKRAYQLYLVKYRQMGAAYPEVLVSQRTLFQLQAGYISALQTVWTHAVALQNYTLSGGLNAAMPSGSTSTTLNLPTSGNGN